MNDITYERVNLALNALKKVLFNLQLLKKIKVFDVQLQKEIY